MAIRNVAMGVVQEKRAMYGVARDLEDQDKTYISLHSDRPS